MAVGHLVLIATLGTARSDTIDQPVWDGSERYLQRPNDGFGLALDCPLKIKPQRDLT